jgi:hypothetical protein
VNTGEGWGGGRHGSDKFVEFPFATVAAVNGKQLLAAVNEAAVEKGLVPGLPLADALSFLPGLATRSAEPAEDAAALIRLSEWCGRYSPWTAPDLNQNGGHEGIKIEITGSAHLWGGEAELAADLSKRLARPRHFPSPGDCRHPRHRLGRRPLHTDGQPHWL